MSSQSRFLAASAYVPVIGWLFVIVLHRKNTLAMYHLRQSIGLVVFLIAVLVIWAAVAWVLAWLPYMGVVGIALFALVMVAYFFGAVAWVLGVIHALREQAVPLPIFGRWASRLPIQS